MTSSIQASSQLTIIHFNDVYDIQSDKLGNGGICNFKASIEDLRRIYPEALLLFSGDCFSPSIFTNAFAGSQMVPALNSLGIDCSAYGNHQFDLDKQQTLKLAKQCNFTWLSSNIIYEKTGKLLGEGKQYKIIKKNQYKIGIFAVAGQDWLEMLPNYDKQQLYYIDYLDHCNRMVSQLKQMGCNFIIALTHVRVPNDRHIGNQIEGIDLILGGHDHIIMGEIINKIPVIKSGSNFYNLSLINISMKNMASNMIHPCKILTEKLNYNETDLLKSQHCSSNNYTYYWSTFKTKSYSQQYYCPELNEHVEKCLTEFRHYDKVIGYTEVDLESRFAQIRTKQTNYGNFMADMARMFYNTDIAILNSGCIRNDTIIPRGRLHLTTISCILDQLFVIKRISGKAIMAILQKSCSACPHIYSGSFLLVSGIRYEYDYKKTPRVISVTVQGEPLIQDKQYTVCLQQYLANGGDGLTFLTKFPLIVDKADCFMHSQMLLKFFQGGDCEQKNGSKQRLSHIYGSRLATNEQIVIDYPQQDILKKVDANQQEIRLSKARSKFVVGQDGGMYVAINPIVDGRIKCLTKQQ